MNVNANDNTNPIQLDISAYTPKEIASLTLQETKNNAVWAGFVRNPQTELHRNLLDEVKHRFRNTLLARLVPNEEVEESLKTKFVAKWRNSLRLATEKVNAHFASEMQRRPVETVPGSDEMDISVRFGGIDLNSNRQEDAETETVHSELTDQTMPTVRTARTNGTANMSIEPTQGSGMGFGAGMKGGMDGGMGGAGMKSGWMAGAGMGMGGAGMGMKKVGGRGGHTPRGGRSGYFNQPFASDDSPHINLNGISEEEDPFSVTDETSLSTEEARNREKHLTAMWKDARDMLKEMKAELKNETDDEARAELEKDIAGWMKKKDDLGKQLGLNQE